MASPVSSLLGTVVTPPVGVQVAGLLMDVGLLTAAQYALSTRIHSKVQTSGTLSSVLIELKFVTEEQIRGVLRSVQASIGDLLVELGRLEPHELKLALAL